MADGEGCHDVRNPFVDDAKLRIVFTFVYFY